MTQVQTLANEQPQEELVREVVYATILDVLSVSEIGAAVVAAAYTDKYELPHHDDYIESMHDVAVSYLMDVVWGVHKPRTQRS